MDIRCNKCGNEHQADSMGYCTHCGSSNQSFFNLPETPGAPDFTEARAALQSRIDALQEQADAAEKGRMLYTNQNTDLVKQVTDLTAERDALQSERDELLKLVTEFQEKQVDKTRGKRDKG